MCPRINHSIRHSVCTVSMSISLPAGLVDDKTLSDNGPRCLDVSLLGTFRRRILLPPFGMPSRCPGIGTQVEIPTITNLRTCASLHNDARAPQRPTWSQAGPARGQDRFPSRGRWAEWALMPPAPCKGRCGDLTTAPMGEVDGAILDDGTVIHWPPHLSDRFSAVITRGDRVRLSGRMKTGPAGRRHAF